MGSRIKSGNELIAQEFGFERLDSIPPEKSPEISVAETNNLNLNSPEVLTWEEFINQQSNEQGWIIKDILRPGWLAVLGGHGKQGKTTFAIHLLNALSQGQQFLKNTQAVPVVHLNFEMHENDLRELIRTVSQDSPQKLNAKVINRLKTPLDFKWFEGLLSKEVPPGVCIVDSFRAAFMLPADSENQAGTVGTILRQLQAIARRTNWTIVVIHHFRKSGTGEALDLAGSGEWNSAPDVIFTWSCPKSTEPGTLVVTGRVPPIEPLAIKLSREEIEFLGSVIENEAESERLSILNTLTDEYTNSKDLAESVGLPDSTVRRRLSELLEKEFVERTGSGKKGDPYLWHKKLLSQKLEERLANKTSDQLTNGELLNIFPGATIAHD